MRTIDPLQLQTSWISSLAASSSVSAADFEKKEEA
jgi:hypothetical protein